MMRFCVWLGAAVVLAGAAASRAQDSHFVTGSVQIPGPGCLAAKWISEGGSVVCTAADYAGWLEDVNHWRTERRIRTGFDETRYGMPALAWTQKSFMQTQAMVHDRYLYDPVTGRYTVSRYLGDLETRYGGIDAVLLWPTYPNLGVDDRNQQEMTLSMPGGLEGVKELVAEFHRRHVRVLFPMMMWDEGTHAPDVPWPQAIARLMKEVDADGVNGDTQDGVPLVFSTEAEKVGHPLAFQPEQGPSDEALAWNVMTWGQYQFSFVPMVDRHKWMQPRHMVNISGRWRKDKTDDLQFAFFNGAGWESWENVWGIWNGITPRDGEATRRVATIERAVAPFLTSAGWQPFYPMLQYGVFASRWPKGEDAVWTIVNRNAYDLGGEELTVPHRDGVRYVDLYHGTALVPVRVGGDDVLSFDLEGRGFGAVAAVGDLRGLAGLVKTMAGMTKAPLASYPGVWSSLPQRMMASASVPVMAMPEGMVKIPAGRFLFAVSGVEIEGGDDSGVDVQYPWEKEARRYHRHEMEMVAFYMDRYPVTNRAFKVFLDATAMRLRTG